MPLREDFERSGEWLFRWRSYVPLVLVAVVLLALRHYTYPDGNHRLDQFWDLLCLAVAFFGLGVRVATVGFVPERTSGRNTRGQIADTLNTSGMYSLMRHPLYFGNFWIWVGISLFPRAWWCTVIVALGAILFYERVMFAEERFLREKFGDVFVQWAERTPVFYPRFSNWRPPTLPFSIRLALKREYTGFFGIIAALTLLEVLGGYVVERRFVIEPLWIVLFGVGAAAYVVLRALKKHHLLDAPGR